MYTHTFTRMFSHSSFSKSYKYLHVINAMRDVDDVGSCFKIGIETPLKISLATYVVLFFF